MWIRMVSLLRLIWFMVQILNFWIWMIFPGRFRPIVHMKMTMGVIYGLIHLNTLLESKVPLDGLNWTSKCGDLTKIINMTILLLVHANYQIKPEATNLKFHVGDQWAIGRKNNIISTWVAHQCCRILMKLLRMLIKDNT